MSQVELGKKLGLSQTRVARIEKDPLSVRTEQLFEFLAALGVRINLEPLPVVQGTLGTSIGPITVNSSATSIPKTEGKGDGDSEDW